MEAGWCTICGTTHALPRDCPGDLRATGTERHGWRVVVDTPQGVEAYGVLVAPSHDLWRARVITYPNILWTAPHGRVTIKFVGVTPQEAEARAVAFIEGHIKARRLKRLDAQEVPPVSAYQAEAYARKLASAGPALRKMRAIPVRFGAGPNLFTAMTANVSESGLFVVTLVPFDPGAGLRVFVDLEQGPVGLRGQVVWKRERPDSGRPVGMGVQLVAPPEPYREFVLELP